MERQDKVDLTRKKIRNQCCRTGGRGWRRAVDAAEACGARYNANAGSSDPVSTTSDAHNVYNRLMQCYYRVYHPIVDALTC